MVPTTAEQRQITGETVGGCFASPIWECGAGNHLNPLLGAFLSSVATRTVSTPTSRIPASTEPGGRRGGHLWFLLMCQPRGRKRKQEAFVVYLKIFDFLSFDSVPLIHSINGQLGHTKVTVVLIDVSA